jgi:tetratricopeptide (TPR) repeat protein
LLLVLVVGGVLAWRKQGTALIGFGLLWVGLFLLPASNLMPMMQYLAERFLYLPLVGWLIALAAAGIWLRQYRWAPAVALVLLLLWAGIAWNRSWIWKDDVTLFVRSAQEGPPTPRVHENAVAAILELPNVQQVFAYDQVANVLSYRGTPDLAAQLNVLRTFEAARELFPDDPAILSCLGICLAGSGQAERALPLLARASELKPANLPYLLNLARAALETKQLPQAKSALDKASALAPEDPEVLRLRFKYCWAGEDYASAKQIMVRLNQIAASDENAHWLASVEAKMRPTSDTHVGDSH